MHKIDIHTHIIPESMPRWSEKFGYGGFIHLDHSHDGSSGHHCKAKMMMDNQFFREIESNCWDAEVRMKECNHHHVDVQVLSTIPVMFSYQAKPQDCLDVSRFLNDHIAGVVKQFPKRFIGLATIPMQSPKLAVKELERSVKELGLAGIQIGSNVNQLNLNEPQFFEIFEAAAELNACIFIHPWEMMGKEVMAKYWLPWLVGMPAETSRAICSMIFGGVFEKLPKLRVAFAHGGGSFPATFARIAHGFDERPDLVAVDNAIHPKNYLGKFWLDSLTHDEKMLRYIMNFAGEEKICLGTDYPFPLGELEPGKLIEEMDLKKKLKRKLLWENAFDWLGIPEIS
ncbi:MAG: amidohydrolase [Chitinophagales bacterium]|nr:amidohydrolase [Chitinophagales bacterium]